MQPGTSAMATISLAARAVKIRQEMMSQRLCITVTNVATTNAQAASMSTETLIITVLRR